MNNAHTYRVVVTREGDHWLADVPDLQGAHTDAKSLHALDRHVREVIVLADDLADEALQGLRIGYEFHTGNERLDSLVRDLREARQVARDHEERAADLTREVVEVARDLSVRDLGVLAGLSFQRIQQLKVS